MSKSSRFLVALLMLFFAVTSDLHAAQPDTKELARKVAQILDKHFAVDSMKLTDRTYFGFTLGESKDKQPAKKPAEMRFEGDKVVGIVREHRSKVDPFRGNEMEVRLADLEKEFGKANAERSWEFDYFDTRKSTRTKTRLIRYTFPKMVAYGWISQHQLWISVYDREYLLGILHRDLEKKLEILASCKPVAALVKAEAIDWKKVPFPEVSGTSARAQSSSLGKYATLKGRNSSNAVLAEEFTRDGQRTVDVAISLYSFPTYEPHPLLGPAPHKAAGFFTESQGKYSTALEMPLLHVPLVAEAFDLGKIEPKRKTVENGTLHGYAFTWETPDGTTIEMAAAA